MVQGAVAETAHAIMLRLGGRKRELHHSQKRFLQGILRLAVAQAQRAAIKDQLRRLRVVERLTPMGFRAAVHDFIP